MARSRRAAGGDDLQTVVRALRILDCFTPEWPEWSVSDLARHLGLAKSVVSRILATLRRQGLVVQDPETRRFRVALRVRRLAAAAEAGLDLEQAARPVLRRLAEATAALVLLTQVDDRRHSAVRGFAGRLWPGIRVIPRVPLHAGASNRVLLAHLPLPAQQAYLAEPLARFTPHTVCEPRVLRGLLVEVRRRGFDWSRAELVPGAACVAVPILTRDGELVGALSVAAPEGRLGDEPPPRLVDALRQAAAELARRA